MSERLYAMALANVQEAVDDLNARERKQFDLIPDAEIDWLQENAAHMTNVSYSGSPVRGFGCHADSPPEIVARTERIIADSVAAMIAAGYKPAFLPRSTADALAKLGIGPTGFSTLYGGDTRSIDIMKEQVRGFMDVWGNKP